jgi:hypothetical protein
MYGPAVKPTDEELAAAKEIYRRDRLARLRERRDERRRLSGWQPIPQSERNYAKAALVCGYCGTLFEARALPAKNRRPSAGRWCSNSCRQLAFQQRKRVAAKRAKAQAEAKARYAAYFNASDG